MRTPSSALPIDFLSLTITLLCHHRPSAGDPDARGAAPFRSGWPGQARPLQCGSGSPSRPFGPPGMTSAEWPISLVHGLVLGAGRVFARIDPDVDDRRLAALGDLLAG